MRGPALGVLLIAAILPSLSIARVITGPGPTACLGGPPAGMVDLDGDGRPDLDVCAYTHRGNDTTTFEAGVVAAPGGTILFTPDTVALGSTVDGSLDFNAQGVGEFAQIGHSLSVGVRV